VLLFSDSCHRTGEQIRLDVLASEANSLDRRAAAIFQSFAKEIARCERASGEELIDRPHLSPRPHPHFLRYRHLRVRGRGLWPGSQPYLS